MNSLYCQGKIHFPETQFKVKDIGKKSFSHSIDEDSFINKSKSNDSLLSEEIESHLSKKKRKQVKSAFLSFFQGDNEGDNSDLDDINERNNQKNFLHDISIREISCSQSQFLSTSVDIQSPNKEKEKKTKKLTEDSQYLLHLKSFIHQRKKSILSPISRKPKETNHHSIANPNYIDFDEFQTSFEFISMDSIPISIQHLQYGMIDKILHNSTRIYQDSQEYHLLSHENQSKNIFLKEFLMKMQKPDIIQELLNHSILNIPNKMDSFNSFPFQSKPNQFEELSPPLHSSSSPRSSRSNSFERSFHHDFDADDHDNEGRIEQKEEFSELKLVEKSQNNKIRTNLGLSARFKDKKNVFTTFEECFSFLLFQLLQHEYFIQDIEISDQEMNDLVIIISLNNYDWIVSKEDILKLLLVPQAAHEDGSFKSIWEHFHPHGIELNSCTIEEIMIDFIHWTTSTAIPMSKYQRQLNSNTLILKNHYFSFTFFKDWLEKEIEKIIKINILQQTPIMLKDNEHFI